LVQSGAVKLKTLFRCRLGFISLDKCC